MKVKRRLPNEDIAWIVVEESPSYYLARHQHQTASSGLSMLSKSGYEPIPEETWRDVTAECEFDQDLYHKPEIHPLWDCNGDIDERYRLRKVGMKELHDLWRGQDYPYAFIIEKKEPA